MVLYERPKVVKGLCYRDNLSGFIGTIKIHLLNILKHVKKAKTSQYGLYILGSSCVTIAKHKKILNRNILLISKVLPRLVNFLKLVYCKMELQVIV